MFAMNATAQRQLEWAVGSPEVICSETTTVTYPLMVRIKKPSKTPVLGTSTIRLFYDSESNPDFEITGIANDYSINGLKISKNIFGDIMGFSSQKGNFVQFDLMYNRANPMSLSNKFQKILDLSFKIEEQSDNLFPECIAIVLDNQLNYKKGSKYRDEGYLSNDAGIVGTYFLNYNFNEVYLADDEVENHGWLPNQGFIGKIKNKNTLVGKKENHRCLESCNTKLNSVEESSEDNFDPFIAYPVPYDHELTLRYQFPYDTSLKLQVFDSKGTLIREIPIGSYKAGTVRKSKIILPNRPVQIYVLKLITHKETRIKRVMPVK